MGGTLRSAKTGDQAAWRIGVCVAYARHDVVTRAAIHMLIEPLAGIVTAPPRTQTPPMYSHSTTVPSRQAPVGDLSWTWINVRVSSISLWLPAICTIGVIADGGTVAVEVGVGDAESLALVLDGGVVVGVGVPVATHAHAGVTDAAADAEFVAPKIMQLAAISAAAINSTIERMIRFIGMGLP